MTENSPATEITVTTQRPDPAAFDRIDNVVAGADTPIRTDAELEDAAERLRTIKALAKDFESARKAAVGPLNDAVKTINGDYRVPIERCTEAEGKLKKAIAAYQQEQERKRREREAELRRQQEEEQARLRREAERREAAERERARKAEEKAREEARKLEEQGRAEAAEAKRQAAERERLEREERARQEAEALRLQAEQTPVAIVEAPAAKVTGISTRKVWKFRITDVTQLPAKYLIADEKKIGKVVRALGDECDIPGIEVYEEAVVAAAAAG